MTPQQSGTNDPVEPSAPPDDSLCTDLNVGVALHVYAGRGFVKHEDTALAKHCPGQAEELALTLWGVGNMV